VNPQLLRMFGFAAVVDLLVGIAVAIVGVSQEELSLQLVGLALLVSGSGMLAFVIVQRNKPTTL
jgi:hypothetical protein